MRILVTGASGFIGAAICARLIGEGRTVVGAGRPAVRRSRKVSPERCWSIWHGRNRLKLEHRTCNISMPW